MRIPTSYIYFIINRRTHDIKIGYSSNVAARLQTLRTGSTDILDCIGWFQVPAPLAGKIERFLHSTWKDQLIAGEWYRCSDSLAAFASQVQYRTTTEVWKEVEIIISTWEEKVGRAKLSYGDRADDDTKLVQQAWVSSLCDPATNRTYPATITFVYLRDQQDTWNLSIFPTGHKKQIVDAWNACKQDGSNLDFMSVACKIVSMSGIGSYMPEELVLMGACA